MSEKHIDEISGVETTGHEWDGIRELNNPMPRWWVWTFYATILWAIGYAIAYPAIPMITSATKGYFGFSSRAELQQDLDLAKASQTKFHDMIAAKTVQEIDADPALREFAIAGGASAFKVNCAPCHGSGASGGPGFPNLNDDDWLWGGGPELIEQTIRVGINAPNAETRVTQMPAFGHDEMLDREQVHNVAAYVYSLSNPGSKKVDPKNVEAGQKLFAANCVACHGDDAKGNPDVGAPNLTDNIWIYGGELETIDTTIWGGRQGHMPTWEDRLSELDRKILTLYLLDLGGVK